MVELIQGYTFEININVNDGYESIEQLLFTSYELDVVNQPITKVDDNNYIFKMSAEETEKIKVKNAFYNVVAQLIDGDIQPIILNEPINIILKNGINTYITKDDFLKFSGKDLDLEFKNGNYDIGDPVPMFIKRVETASIALLEERYENPNIEEKINKNLIKFKEGMCWQIQHILDNGELYLSEFDKKRYLNDIALSQWRLIGLCNLPRY